MDPAKEKEIEEEYLSSLMDLNVNSKPLINMLTMLAEDNMENGSIIVRAIEKHMSQVNPEIKLPILYLIDSIVKNVGNKYKQLFAQNIVNIFCGVFEKVNEKVREKMFNLRQTWNDVFPQTKLYALDVKVNVMDNHWPITAKVLPKSVHVNPNFLKKSAEKNPETQAKEDLVLQMQAKERELLELKQRKIELELMVTKKKIAEQEKEISHDIPPSTSGASISSVAVGPGHVMPVASSMIVPPHHPQGRIRIAPVSSAMVSSARPRDPRLLKARPIQSEVVPSTTMPMSSMMAGVQSGSVSKLPRIPKYSNGNRPPASTTVAATVSSHDHDDRDNRHHDRDPRDSRRRREKDHESKEKSSSSGRKSSKSSHDSPRKKSDDEKKVSKSGSGSLSHHKSSSSASSSHSRSSRSATKSPSKTESKLRDAEAIESLFQATDMDMRPDSTTAAASSKISKNKLLDELLHDEDLKSSQDMMITTSNNDSKSEEKGKKRSIGSDGVVGEDEQPNGAEPSKKKNKIESDSLFGSEDVDLRSVQPTLEKKPKTKADFEAVRAKLNASKARSKTTGVKLLEEIQPAPITENGTSAELVKKILQKKKHDHKEPSESAIAGPSHGSDQVNDIVMAEKKDEPVDYGNMTAAELRNSASVPASIRKKERKETKWSQPTMPWGMPLPPMNNRLMNNPNIPLPHHFINPWESDPMVKTMQKQSQVPLVLPQSPSQPILNNKMRTLRLDGTKDHLLRFYGEVAMIFNEAGEAHDIRFSLGQSKVIIDDMYSEIMSFNDSYKPMLIDGVLHRIKFGSPTRELYIDENFYECYFNNQTTQIILGDKVRRVRIEGKAPEVKIGSKRNDIVLGLINMMIDAEIMVPVFLDTTVQYFEYKGQIFTLQFADFFLSVIINNEPFKVEFGGLPKNFMLNGQKHFIRFTVLPENINPGQVNMHGMRRTHLFRNCKSPPIIQHPNAHAEQMQLMDINQLVESDMTKHLPHMHHGAAMETQQQQQQQSNITLPDLNISELLQKLVATGIIGNNANSSSSAAAAAATKSANAAEVEKNNAKATSDAQRQYEPKHKIIPVNLSRPESIKMRQQAIIDTLYLGIQCSSCGLRFPAEQTIKYSQHLDWHFRQNRRERDSKRKAHSRKWYYTRSDWIKYEEIEDLDEREKNFFETQQMEAMDQGEDSNGLSRLPGQESSSCPAGPDDVNRCCDMCHDQFEQFFNEETEEWNLRSAIKVDDKFFHPICYEDYKSSLTLDESALNEAANDSQVEDSKEEEEDAASVKEEKKKPDADGETKRENADDDDDVIVLPPEEPVITEIADEAEPDQEMAEVIATSQTSDGPQMLNTIIDDDIMIQEPKIETQIVNDDDDDTDDSNSAQCTSGDTNMLPLIVKIKEEPKDDGYENNAEEDPFIEVTSINEDLMLDDGHTHSPFQPALDENAVFDESSLFSHNSNHELATDNDDNGSRPELSGTEPVVVGGNRNIKIVLSSLAQNNLSNKGAGSNNFVNTEQNENSNVDANNKFVDSNSNDLKKPSEDRSGREDSTQENTDLPYTVKPSLQGFAFEKNPVAVKRGIENSGLCSIM